MTLIFSNDNRLLFNIQNNDQLLELCYNTRFTTRLDWKKSDKQLFTRYKTYLDRYRKTNFLWDEASSLIGKAELYTPAALEAALEATFGKYKAKLCKKICNSERPLLLLPSKRQRSAEPSLTFAEQNSEKKKAVRKHLLNEKQISFKPVLFDLVNSQDTTSLALQSFSTIEILSLYGFLQNQPILIQKHFKDYLVFNTVKLCKKKPLSFFYKKRLPLDQNNKEIERLWSTKIFAFLKKQVSITFARSYFCRAKVCRARPNFLTNRRFVVAKAKQNSEKFCKTIKHFFPKTKIWSFAFGSSFLFVTITSILQQQEQNRWLLALSKNQMPGFSVTSQESSLESFENITLKYLSRPAFTYKYLGGKATKPFGPSGTGFLKKIECYKDIWFFSFSKSWNQQFFHDYVAVFPKAFERAELSLPQDSLFTPCFIPRDRVKVSLHKKKDEKSVISRGPRRVKVSFETFFDRKKKVGLLFQVATLPVFNFGFFSLRGLSCKSLESFSASEAFSVSEADSEAASYKAKLSLAASEAFSASESAKLSTTKKLPEKASLCKPTPTSTHTPNKASLCKSKKLPTPEKASESLSAELTQKLTNCKKLSKRADSRELYTEDLHKKLAKQKESEAVVQSLSQKLLFQNKPFLQPWYKMHARIPPKKMQSDLGSFSELSGCAEPLEGWKKTRLKRNSYKGFVDAENDSIPSKISCSKRESFCKKSKTRSFLASRFLPDEALYLSNFPKNDSKNLFYSEKGSEKLSYKSSFKKPLTNHFANTSLVLTFAKEASEPPVGPIQTFATTKLFTKPSHVFVRKQRFANKMELCTRQHDRLKNLFYKGGNFSIESKAFQDSSQESDSLYDSRFAFKKVKRYFERLTNTSCFSFLQEKSFFKPALERYAFLVYSAKLSQKPPCTNLLTKRSFVLANPCTKGAKGLQSEALSETRGFSYPLDSAKRNSFCVQVGSLEGEQRDRLYQSFESLSASEALSASKSAELTQKLSTSEKASESLSAELTQKLTNCKKLSNQNNGILPFCKKSNKKTSLLTSKTFPSCTCFFPSVEDAKSKTLSYTSLKGSLSKSTEKLSSYFLYKRKTISNRFMSGYQQPESEKLQLKTKLFKNKVTFANPCFRYYKYKAFKSAKLTKTNLLTKLRRQIEDLYVLVRKKICQKVWIGPTSLKSRSEFCSAKVRPTTKGAKGLQSEALSGSFLVVGSEAASEADNASKDLFTKQSFIRKSEIFLPKVSIKIPPALPFYESKIQKWGLVLQSFLQSEALYLHDLQSRSQQRAELFKPWWRSHLPLRAKVQNESLEKPRLESLKKIPYRQLVLNELQEVEPLFDQVAKTSRVSPYFFTFKKVLFTDYNDYLSWFKDTPAAIAITPSIEEEKSIRDSWFAEQAFSKGLKSEALSSSLDPSFMPSESLSASEVASEAASEGANSSKNSAQEGTPQLVIGSGLQSEALSGSFLVVGSEAASEADNASEAAAEAVSEADSEDAPQLVSFLQSKALYDSKDAEQLVSFADSEEDTTSLSIGEDDDKKREITKFEWLQQVREAEHLVEKRKEFQKLAYPNREALFSKRLHAKPGMIQRRVVSDRKDSFFGIANLFPKRLVAQDQKQISSQILQNEQDRRSILLFLVRTGQEEAFSKNSDIDKIGTLIFENKTTPEGAGGSKSAELTNTKSFIKNFLRNSSFYKEEKNKALVSSFRIKPRFAKQPLHNGANSKGLHRLPEETIFRTRQHPIYTANRRLRLCAPQPCLSSQNGNPQSRIDDLILSQSHRWWQKRRSSSSLLGAPSKRYLVMPEITAQDWKKIIEWQLKTYLLEEEKRLEPLVLEKSRSHKPLESASEATSKALSAFGAAKLPTPEKASLCKTKKNKASFIKDAQNKTLPTISHSPNDTLLSSPESSTTKHLFKIKKIALYLPWTTLKKSLKKPFEWPLTGLSYTSLGRFDTFPFAYFGLGVGLQSEAFPGSFLLVGVGSEAASEAASEADNTSEAASEAENANCKGQRFVRSFVLAQGGFATKRNKQKNGKPKLCFVSSISPHFKTSFLSSQNLEGNLVVNNLHKTSAYKPFLFQGQTKNSYLLLHQLLLAVATKQLFQCLYKVFGKIITHKIKNSSLAIFLLPIFLNATARRNEISCFYDIKKRLKDLVGSEDTISSLSEIVWYLRNSCRGRMIPRGVVLVETLSSESLLPPEALSASEAASLPTPTRTPTTQKLSNESTNYLKAVGGEAQVPVIVQSLRALPFTQNHPQRRLEKILTFAQKRAPCILFLDDLDSIGQSRTLLLKNNYGHLTPSKTDPFSFSAPFAQTRGSYGEKAEKRKWKAFSSFGSLGVPSYKNELSLRLFGANLSGFSTLCKGRTRRQQSCLRSCLKSFARHKKDEELSCFSVFAKQKQNHKAFDSTIAYKAPLSSQSKTGATFLQSSAFSARGGNNARRVWWLRHQGSSNTKGTNGLQSEDLSGSFLQSEALSGVGSFAASEATYASKDLQSERRNKASYKYKYKAKLCKKLCKKLCLAFSASKSYKAKLCKKRTTPIFGASTSTSTSTGTKRSCVTSFVTSFVRRFAKQNKEQSSATKKTKQNEEKTNNGLQRSETETFIEQRRVDLMLRLLTVMDGITDLSGVLIVTTSKNPASLDPALLRPGRFEKLINLELPNKKKRIELLKMETAKIGHTDFMPWEFFGTQTQDMTGAEISSAVNHSAFRAIIQSTVHTFPTLEHGISCVAGHKALPPNPEHRILRNRYKATQTSSTFVCTCNTSFVRKPWFRQLLKRRRRQRSYLRSCQTKLRFVRSCLSSCHRSCLRQTKLRFVRRHLKLCQSSYKASYKYKASKSAKLTKTNRRFVRKKLCTCKKLCKKLYCLKKSFCISYSYLRKYFQLYKKSTQNKKGLFYNTIGKEAWWTEKIAETLKTFKRPSGNWYRLYLPKIEQNKNNREWLLPDTFVNQHISFFEQKDLKNLTFIQPCPRGQVAPPPRFRQLLTKRSFVWQRSCLRLRLTSHLKQIENLQTPAFATTSTYKSSICLQSFVRRFVRKAARAELYLPPKVQRALLNQQFSTLALSQSDCCFGSAAFCKTKRIEKKESDTSFLYYTMALARFYLAFQNCSDNREILDLLADHLIRFKTGRLHEIMRIGAFYF